MPKMKTKYISQNSSENGTISRISSSKKQITGSIEILLTNVKVNRVIFLNEVNHKE